MSVNDGGPAFPAPDLGERDFGVRAAYNGMTLRDYMAIHAPEPLDSDVESLMAYEMSRNPHNDGPPKPQRRTRDEIVCALRYRRADAMLKERDRDRQ